MSEEEFDFVKLALGPKSWLVASVPAFLVALWGSFMIGEMAVIWSDLPAWPAKTILCPSGTRPEIVRTAEPTRHHSSHSTHTNHQWSLVCHTQSGASNPGGVFWVQIGFWWVMLFPVFLFLTWLILRAWARRQSS